MFVLSFIYLIPCLVTESVSLWLTSLGSPLMNSRNTATILLTKITAARNEVALSYHRVRGLYFLINIFTVTICFWLILREFVDEV